MSRAKVIPVRVLAAFAALLLVCLPARATTLHEVLVENKVPDAELSFHDAWDDITSFATLDAPDSFVIAYYNDDGSGRLQPPLVIRRYTKAPRRWEMTTLRDDNGIDPNCFGSVLDVHGSAGFLVMDTHINPSAGCLLILTDDLKLRKVLMGWYLAGFYSGEILFHENEIHFAPTHPMHISLYDPGKEKIIPVYPPPQDARRDAYIRRLNKVKPSQDWCRQHNSPCSAEGFSSELVGAVAINQDNGSFAFVAQYDGTDFAADTAWQEEVVYVYCMEDGHLTHREFHPTMARHDSGRASYLHDLLDPVALAKLFSE